MGPHFYSTEILTSIPLLGNPGYLRLFFAKRLVTRANTYPAGWRDENPVIPPNQAESVLAKKALAGSTKPLTPLRGSHLSLKSS
jgi:hypothetical protein